MATSALGQNINTAASLSTLLSTLLGSGDQTTTTSGGTSTTTKQTNIDAAGLQSLIQSMLEDQSTGLAKVASGSKQAGLYNASTNTLLVNDLISRASTAAALASAPTTTTKTSTPETRVISAEGMLGANSNVLLPLLGAGLLMKKDDAGKSVFDNLLGSVFGGGSSSESGDFALGGMSVIDSSTGSSALDTALNLGTSALQSTTSAWTDLIYNPLDQIVSSIDYGDVASSVTDSGLFDSISTGAEDLWDTIISWF